MSRPTLTPKVEEQMLAAIRADQGRHIVMPAAAYSADGSVRVNRDGLSGVRAQRHLYRKLIGPLELHEFLKKTCIQTGCLNPYHYRVTEKSREGMTSCIHGHEYTPENTLPDGRYRCRTCRDAELERQREAYRAKARTKLQSPVDVNRVKTHCIHDHEFTEENTYYYEYRGRRRRTCRTCAIERTRENRRTRREANQSTQLRKAS